jgi:type IV pilus assembly protein PilB
MSEPSAGSVTIAARPAPTTQIGEMLVDGGLLNPADLEAALEMQRHTGVRLGETLVSLGFVSAYDIARFVARRLGIEFVDLNETPVDQHLALSVSEEIARRYLAIPVVRRDEGVIVVMTNPQDVFAIDDLRMLLGAPVIPAMADRDQLLAAIERIWPGDTMASTVDDASLEAADELTAPVAVTEDAPIVRLVNAILSQAIEDRASVIHLEPGATRLRVRFRVDGVLHDASEAPLSVHRAVTSRLKIMAGIDITQTRLPQDGRFSVNHNGEPVDIRMATLPTAYGEAAVLRLLDQRTGVIRLGALGFEADQLERYEAAFRMPQGAILASGPTGSGKTSNS